MIRYIIRRILLTVPVLFIITASVFWMERALTGDPLAARSDVRYSGRSFDPALQQAFYTHEARLSGVDKPDFYWSVQDCALPDTAYRIFPYWRREILLRLARETGDWNRVVAYEKALSLWIKSFEAADTAAIKTSTNQTLTNLLAAPNAAATQAAVEQAGQLMLRQTPDCALCAQHFETLVLAAAQLTLPREKAPFPSVRWHGADNMYHDWLNGFLGLDDRGQGNIWLSLRGPMRMTLWVSFWALFLSVLVSVPLGLWSARRPGRIADRVTRWSGMALYALPILVIACVIRLLFGTSGAYFDLTGGIDLPSYDQVAAEKSWSFVRYCWHFRAKLAMPVAVLALHNTALLTLQMRNGVLDVMQKDYIRTARSKGLPLRSILFRHVLPNAIFPFITALATLIPVLLGGAVVTEAVFNYHGLGEATLSALEMHKTPLLMAILTLISVTTVVCSLIADLLYGWLDPRVKLES